MTVHFEDLIDRIKAVEEIQSSEELSAYLGKIETLSETNEQAAYLLGQFFRYKFDSDRLPLTIHKQLRQTIKSQHVKEYYYLRAKPEDDMDLFVLLLIMGGVASVIIGIMRLIDGSILISQNLRYLGLIFDNGGFGIILGLVLSISGFLRHRHNKKVRALTRNLQLD